MQTDPIADMLTRICLRELAHQGAIPGMTKSSW